MKQLVPLLLLLAACGRPASKDEPVQLTGQQDTPPADPQTVAPEPQPSPVPAVPAPMQSLAIATADDMGTCTAANNRQLVYVLDTKTFHTCQDGAWVAIDISESMLPSAEQWFNTLSTVELGKTMDQLLPEARAILLSDAVEFTENPPVDCAGGGTTTIKKYKLYNYGNEEFKFSFVLELSNGNTQSIWYKVEGQDGNGTSKNAALTCA